MLLRPVYGCLLLRFYNQSHQYTTSSAHVKLNVCGTTRPKEVLTSTYRYVYILFTKNTAGLLSTNYIVIGLIGSNSKTM